MRVLILGGPMIGSDGEEQDIGVGGWTVSVGMTRSWAIGDGCSFALLSTGSGGTRAGTETPNAPTIGVPML